MPRRRSPGRPVELDRDHARPRTAPAPRSEAIEAQLIELVSPAAFGVRDYYSQLGMRERILSLPVMVGIMLSLNWRQMASVSELRRVMEREPLLWVPPQRVSQQALSARLRELPAELFARVWSEVQPLLVARARERQRPIPQVLARVQEHTIRRFGPRTAPNWKPSSRRSVGYAIRKGRCSAGRLKRSLIW